MLGSSQLSNLMVQPSWPGAGRKAALNAADAFYEPWAGATRPN